MMSSRDENSGIDERRARREPDDIISFMAVLSELRSSYSKNRKKKRHEND